jgi:hypothetical protein
LGIFFSANLALRRIPTVGTFLGFAVGVVDFLVVAFLAGFVFFTALKAAAFGLTAFLDNRPGTFKPRPNNPPFNSSHFLYKRLKT